LVFNLRRAKRLVRFGGRRMERSGGLVRESQRFLSPVNAPFGRW
jgi:hypothetical protein